MRLGRPGLGLPLLLVALLHLLLLLLRDLLVLGGRAPGLGVHLDLPGQELVAPEIRVAEDHHGDLVLPGGGRPEPEPDGPVAALFLQGLQLAWEELLDALVAVLVLAHLRESRKAPFGKLLQQRSPEPALLGLLHLHAAVAVQQVGLQVAAKEIPLLRLLVGPPRRNSGHDLALCVGNVIHLGEGVQNLLVQFLALLRVGAAGLGDVLVDEGVVRGLLVRRHVLLLLSNCRKVGPPPELELQLADRRVEDHDLLLLVAIALALLHVDDGERPDHGKALLHTVLAHFLVKRFCEKPPEVSVRQGHELVEPFGLHLAVLGALGEHLDHVLTDIRQLVQPSVSLRRFAGVGARALGPGPLHFGRHGLNDALHGFNDGLGRGEPAEVVPGDPWQCSCLDKLAHQLGHHFQNTVLLELLRTDDPVGPRQHGKVGPDQLDLLLEHLVALLERLVPDKVLHQRLQKRIVLLLNWELSKLRCTGQRLDHPVDRVGLLDVDRGLGLVQPDPKRFDHHVVGVPLGVVKPAHGERRG